MQFSYSICRRTLVIGNAAGVYIGTARRLVVRLRASLQSLQHLTLFRALNPGHVPRFDSPFHRPNGLEFQADAILHIWSSLHRCIATSQCTTNSEVQVPYTFHTEASNPDLPARRSLSASAHPAAEPSLEMQEVVSIKPMCAYGCSIPALAGRVHSARIASDSFGTPYRAIQAYLRGDIKICNDKLQHVDSTMWAIRLVGSGNDSSKRLLAARECT